VKLKKYKKEIGDILSGFNKYKNSRIYYLSLLIGYYNLE